MLFTTIYTLGDGGIFRSSNRGDSWAQHGAGIANILFYDIAISEVDPDLVIGGTQDNGTLKYHGSDTWKEILGGDGGTVDIDPANPQTLYAMLQYISSIRRSTDGGSSWSPIGAGLPQGSVCFNAHFQVVRSDTSHLHASCMSLWRTARRTSTSGRLPTLASSFVGVNAALPGRVGRAMKMAMAMEGMAMMGMIS